MIRISSSLLMRNSTYFLDSVYTKEKGVTAETYAEIIKKIAGEINPKASSLFRGINGLVSDIASTCVKAKRLVAEQYTGLVSIQDQAHAADLLMSDLGDFPWIKKVLTKIAKVVHVTKRNRKLASRFKDLIEAYNKKQKGIADSWDYMDNDELEEMQEVLSSSPAVAIGLEDDSSLRITDRLTDNTGRETQGAESQPVQQGSENRFSSIRQTAVTLKKTVCTRFASAETMLEAFIRSRNVLKTLTLHSEFQKLFEASSAATKEKREEFVQTVNDEVLLGEVQEVREILRVIRRYLRIWDADGCQVSEVAPATILLEDELKSLPETRFLTKERKRTVVGALERRCSAPAIRKGDGMQVKIVQDVHYAAWLLDPVLSPARIHDYLPAFKRHFAYYLKGTEDGSSWEELEKKVKEVTSVFKSIRKYWQTLRQQGDNEEVLESFACSPISYWESEYPTALRCTELVAFAASTLGLCPSSCATERSFSHQGRIHTKHRNRMKPDVVRKLLFCMWNSRELRRLKRISYSEVNLDILLKGAVKPYDDIFHARSMASLFDDAKDAESDSKRFKTLSRVQKEIESAREQLYKSSHRWTQTRGQTGRSSVATSTALPGDSFSLEDGATTATRTTQPVSATLGDGGGPQVGTPSSVHVSSRAELQELVRVSKNLDQQFNDQEQQQFDRAGPGQGMERSPVRWPTVRDPEDLAHDINPTERPCATDLGNEGEQNTQANVTVPLGVTYELLRDAEGRANIPSRALSIARQQLSEARTPGQPQVTRGAYANARMTTYPQTPASGDLYIAPSATVGVYRPPASASVPSQVPQPPEDMDEIQYGAQGTVSGIGRRQTHRFQRHRNSTLWDRKLERAGPYPSFNCQRSTEREMGHVPPPTVPLSSDNAARRSFVPPNTADETARQFIPHMRPYGIFSGPSQATVGQMAASDLPEPDTVQAMNEALNPPSPQRADTLGAHGSAGTSASKFIRRGERTE